MTAGVYQILNKVNNRRYIAGSINAEQVLISTVKILSTNVSPDIASGWLNSDRRISVDWNLYGKDCFTWGLIEKTSTSKSTISKRALYWCRILQPFYNEYEYSPIVSGVYQILDTQNYSSYIGQSKDIFQRWRQHKAELKCSRHPNKYLQASYNLHGESSFELRILEVYQPDLKSLVELEKQWIKKTDNLFNIVV